MAAIIAASGFVSVPLPFSPVPVVLQNVVVVAAGLALPPAWSFAAVAAWYLLGAAGLPLFGGFRGGLGHIFGPTGGYLVGYLISAPLTGLIAGVRPMRSEEAGDGATDTAAGGVTPGRAPLWRVALAVVVGMVVVYLPGVPWLALRAGMTLSAALSVGMVPYLPVDGAKALALIALTAVSIRRWNGSTSQL